MKQLFLLFFAFFGLLCASAQQVQEERRSEQLWMFPQFKEGKVVQSFGRFVRNKVNIHYKNAALCFIDPQDGKVKQVTTPSVLGVEIDSVQYMRVDKERMGRVVAQQGYNKLIAVVTVDMKRYKEVTSGGTDLPFLEIDMAGYGTDQFMDLSGSEQQANKGYPLRTDYYFSLKGRIVAARERLVKKEIAPEMKGAFKTLMGDRWWSWNDEKSLTKLLIYFPK